MSTSLHKMVDYIKAAVNVSEDAFTIRQYHRAIQAAGEHYHSEVRPASQSSNITVASGATSVDVTSTVTGFVQDDMFGQEAYIDSYAVKLVGYQKIARRLQGTPATGRPAKMAFLTDDALHFDKEADQEYTLVLPHVARLTPFTIGTTADDALNIPTADAVQLAYTGCVWYLLKGQYDEAGETAEARAGFMRLLEEAKTRYPNTRSAIRDRQVKT